MVTIADQEPQIISPWHQETVALESPDEEWSVVLESPMEIAMGAPTSGTLRFPSGKIIEGCNPSMVWSDDSRYVAVPQWSGRDAHQRLLVVDVASGQTWRSSARFRVLELHSFASGIITAVDSPVGDARKVRIPFVGKQAHKENREQDQST